MANLYDPEWELLQMTPKELLELMQENKRLKKLAHDLQHEIEVKALESQETHELEEK